MRAVGIDASQAVGEEGDEPVGGLRVAADPVEDPPVVHPGFEGADQVGEGAGIAMVGQGHDRLLVGLAYEGVVGRPDVRTVGGAQGGHDLGPVGGGRSIGHAEQERQAHGGARVDGALVVGLRTELLKRLGPYRDVRDSMFWRWPGTPHT
ncbi:hypothetical protein G3I32_34400 [Streptomyces coelicoflavus]|uniref:Uncharacterized protein n=1 Tax=Streptomyces coelicoflavus TaxID=285562 RepID=A0A7K3PV63_9ACTN|nr:hypothetical protein [Streptomyces coelicoflavus]NEB13874.1 hypothetical protein [Streptomyces coelicoflavus]